MRDTEEQFESRLLSLFVNRRRKVGGSSATVLRWGGATAPVSVPAAWDGARGVDVRHGETAAHVYWGVKRSSRCLKGSPALCYAHSLSKGRAIVAMNGGVDSSVAALLLQQEGGEVIGVTMRL